MNWKQITLSNNVNLRREKKQLYSSYQIILPISVDVVIYYAFYCFSGVKVQVVTPGAVTWNSAMISWKTTHMSFRSYRLTYQFEGEIKVSILKI